jgi:hypothetical protein
MEMERDGHPLFLDTDIYSRPDGSQSHKVYHKPTHTSLYLKSSSHHLPSNKLALLSTLVHRIRALCDQYSFHAQLVFLGNIFSQNGYTDWQIHMALNPPLRVAQHNKKPGVCSIPCECSQVYTG